jgi:hypothetical protein
MAVGRFDNGVFVAGLGRGVHGAAVLGICDWIQNGVGLYGDCIDMSVASSREYQKAYSRERIQNRMEVEEIINRAPARFLLFYQAILWYNAGND